jgi:hypothetical protein
MTIWNKKFLIQWNTDVALVRFKVNLESMSVQIGRIVGKIVARHSTFFIV